MREEQSKAWSLLDTTHHLEKGQEESPILKKILASLISGILRLWWKSLGGSWKLMHFCPHRVLVLTVKFRYLGIFLCLSHLSISGIGDGQLLTL